MNIVTGWVNTYVDAYTVKWRRVGSLMEFTVNTRQVLLPNGLEAVPNTICINSMTANSLSGSCQIVGWGWENKVVQSTGCCCNCKCKMKSEVHTENVLTEFTISMNTHGALQYQCVLSGNYIAHFTGGARVLGYKRAGEVIQLESGMTSIRRSEFL